MQTNRTYYHGRPDDGRCLAPHRLAHSQSHQRHAGINANRTEKHRRTALYPLRQLCHRLSGGLRPLDMANNIRINQLDVAVDIGLKDCISCGCCSYICPSNIPLVQYFKYASGEVAARQQAQHKSEQTKRLMEARNARMERIAEQQALPRNKRARKRRDQIPSLTATSNARQTQR